jgi:predicted DNA-binding transcriptional regulator YafY
MYDPTMRVLTVLELLQTHERITGAMLAERLEVHPRTVQRYITRLQDLGIPVEGTRGVAGSYRLKPGFRLPPMMFSDEEALALTLGLRALRYLGLNAFAPASEGASAKLRRVLPRAVGQRVQAIDEVLELDADPWIISADAVKVLGLAAAVPEKHPVTIAYANKTGETTERVVEPYGVLYEDGRWYMVGYCRLRRDTRCFRVDRISKINVLEETFERPENIDVKAILLESLATTPAPFEVKVWLGLSVEAARHRIIPAYATLTTSSSSDSTLLTCGVEDLEWFATILLSLGCKIIVHEPIELCQAFKAVAEKAKNISKGL